MRFTRITGNVFNELQMDAGILLNTFNPTSPNVQDEHIICATTGGINAVAEPTYSDLLEDVDNAPLNTKEGKHLDGWDCRLETTAVGVSPEVVKLSLGAADIDGSNEAKILPRRHLAQTDFSDIWWVGDKADGGYAAVRLIDALSTGGFSLQTTKNGKGELAMVITGHSSLYDADTVPMEFYVYDGEEDVYTVRQKLTHCTSSFETDIIAAGENLSAVLTADTGYTIANVIVLYNGEDVTSTKYTSGTHTVAITSVAGDIEIFATAKANG